MPQVGLMSRQINRDATNAVARDGANPELVHAPAAVSESGLGGKVAFSAIAQFAARILLLGIGLVTLRLTATYLGPSVFGEYAIVTALTGLVVVLADLGVATTLAREVAKTPDRADEIGADLFGYRILTSVVAALVLLAALPLLPYNHHTKIGLTVAVIGMTSTSLANFPIAFFQANLKLHLGAALELSAKALGLVSVLIVGFFHLGFYVLLGAFSAINVLYALAAFWISKRFWRVSIRFKWDRAWRLIRDSFGIGLILAIGLIHFRGDAIILSMLRTPRDVGIYTIAYRFVDQAYLVPGLFLATLFPLMTRALNSVEGNADRLVNRAFKVLLFLGVSMAMSIFILAPSLVHLLGGGAYSASANPLRVLAVALIFLFVSPIFFNVLIALNKQRALITIGTAALAFNIAVNLVLIGRYGYEGAAVATVVCELVSLVVLYSVAKRAAPLHIDWALIVRVVAATAAAAIVGVALWGASPWAVVAATEGTLVVCAMLFGVITPRDARFVRSRGVIRLAGGEAP